MHQLTVVGLDGPDPHPLLLPLPPLPLLLPPPPLLLLPGGCVPDVDGGVDGVFGFVGGVDGVFGFVGGVDCVGQFAPESITDPSRHVFVVGGVGGGTDVNRSVVVDGVNV